MNKTRSSLISLVLVSIFALSGLTAGTNAQSKDSLYKRLGGYDAIAAVSDDFILRLATDKQLGRFFVGLSADSQKRVRQLVVDQLCAATGGPCVYIGRSMKTAHAGLGITNSDWDVSVKHLVESLDKFKVPKREKDELLGALTTLKGDIVEK
ncbi:MAG TPA: group 1 truncated hemoglobin [Blastocatellia bacterium]|nr:group 1 truncated hemoglobin [Blastocatellia bacterium]